MGDDRWKHAPPPPGKGAVARFSEWARPLLMRGAAFAKTLPGRARELGERIDMPRRIAQARIWVEAQHFPDKAERLGSELAKASRTAMAASRKGADKAQAVAGPVLRTAGGQTVAAARGAARAIASRAAVFGGLIASGWAKVAERRAEAIAQKAAAAHAPLPARDAHVPPPPVPSELMRLLKEEGVAVDGMDVREALPKPVRPGPSSAQGALPLFADEPVPPFPLPSQPEQDSMPPPSPVMPPADPPSEQPRAASRWAALKILGAALFNRTADQPFYQNRTFQMTLGATLFLAAAGAAALMMQGGAGSSPAAPTAQTGALDRAEVEAIVRDYILEHPEIIPEAIDRLQAIRMSSVVDRYRSELETPFAGGFDGARDGDVVLVEFFDYACGYCKASLPDIDRLLAEDKGLKVVYRELPILSDESSEAAKASLYAAKQGRYSAFHRALYAAGRPSKDSIAAAAKKAGLDPAALAGGMSASDIGSEIENNLRLAQALQATGTPTWVIGDQVLSGAVGYDALKTAIAKARAEKP